MKLAELINHFSTLKTNDGIRAFLTNPPDIEDVDEWFKGRKGLGSKAMQAFDDLVHDEKVLYVWLREYEKWSKQFAESLKKNIDMREISQSVLIAMLGGENPNRGPAKYDYETYEEVMRAMRICCFLSAKLDLDVQMRLGADNYYEIGSDGKVYVAADIRTTLYSIASAV